MGDEEKGVPDCFWDSDEGGEATGKEDVAKDHPVSDRQGNEEESPIEEEEAVKPKAATQPRLPTS